MANLLRCTYMSMGRLAIPQGSDAVAEGGSAFVLFVLDGQAELFLENFGEVGLGAGFLAPARQLFAQTLQLTQFVPGRHLFIDGIFFEEVLDAMNRFVDNRQRRLEIFVLDSAHRLGACLVRQDKPAILVEHPGVFFIEGVFASEGKDVEISLGVLGRSFEFSQIEKAHAPLKIQQRFGRQKLTIAAGEVKALGFLIRSPEKMIVVGWIPKGFAAVWSALQLQLKYSQSKSALEFRSAVVPLNQSDRWIFQRPFH